MVTSEGEDLWYATLQQNDGGWKLDGGATTLRPVGVQKQTRKVVA